MLKITVKKKYLKDEIVYKVLQHFYNQLYIQ